MTLTVLNVLKGRIFQGEFILDISALPFETTKSAVKYPEETKPQTQCCKNLKFTTLLR